MSAQKKPGLGDILLSRGWARAVTQALTVLMGRGGDKVDQVAVTAKNAAGATPTAAEFAAVVHDLNVLKTAFNQLLEQVQDS